MTVTECIEISCIGQYERSEILFAISTTMDTISKQVKVFDAFPKVAPEHSVRSARGGFSTLLTVICALLIIWVQIGGFLGGYVDHQFSVDKEIRLELSLNIDILVAMPCQFLRTNVMDITSDRFMAGDVLNFEGTGFFTPQFFSINSENNYHDTPELDEIMQETLRAEFAVTGLKLNEEAPACHIFGSIPVNHVKGEFFIVPAGTLGHDRLTVAEEAYNMSHVISEFSYGDFYPFINNPLDFTGKVTTEHRQAYKYFAKVVPTVYEKLGMIVDTYQYALTEIHHIAQKGSQISPPGIYFTYSFEPIKLTIRDKRIGFFLFVAKLATILSGLLIAAGYLFRLYERLLRIVYGKKFVEKDTEKKQGGLLDRQTPDSKDF